MVNGIIIISRYTTTRGDGIGAITATEAIESLV